MAGWHPAGRRGLTPTLRDARKLRRIALGVLGAVVCTGMVFLVVTAGQVWIASRRDGAAPAQAIVVLGAAQYNGRPSPVLAARLDHALALWQRHLAGVIVVTGGRAVGDQFTESAASARYLQDRGVPDASVLREISGRNSWESLSASAGFLRARGLTRVLLVSDPFHAERLQEMARELGLRGAVSPTRSSPIRGAAVIPHMARETVAVAAGRLIGFRRLLRVEHWAGRPT